MDQYNDGTFLVPLIFPLIIFAPLINYACFFQTPFKKPRHVGLLNSISITPQITFL